MRGSFISLEMMLGETPSPSSGMLARMARLRGWDSAFDTADFCDSNIVAPCLGLLVEEACASSAHLIAESDIDTPTCF